MAGHPGRTVRRVVPGGVQRCVSLLSGSSVPPARQERGGLAELDKLGQGLAVTLEAPLPVVLEGVGHIGGEKRLRLLLRTVQLTPNFGGARLWRQAAKRGQPGGEMVGPAVGGPLPECLNPAPDRRQLFPGAEHRAMFSRPPANRDLERVTSCILGLLFRIAGGL